MYHPRPYGSFYDMGFKYGSLLRQKEIAPLAMTQRQAEFGEKCYQFVNGTQIQPGITFHLIIRKVLETCRTVADAIALIQAAKVASANNFLIADAAGNMAVVESAPQGAEVRYPAANENFLCITNQFQHLKMQAFDQGGIGWCRSAERYQYLRDRLSQSPQINVDSAKEILSTAPVCLDLRREQFGTLWSVVANLKTLAITRAEGKPKTTNYHPDPRLPWWLQKRPSPALAHH